MTPLDTARTAAGKLPYPGRSYTVEPWSHYLNLGRRTHVFRLRCYGLGVCTFGEGVPAVYATEMEAHRAGREWTAYGVAPADQRGLA